VGLLSLGRSRWRWRWEEQTQEGGNFLRACELVSPSSAPTIVLSEKTTVSSPIFEY
jgi:hypothetical protein